MTGSQSQKEAITAPERHYLQNCKQDSLLTKTSWGSVVFLVWAARTWEGHKTQAQPSLRLWGLPECLNLSGLDLGGASSPGPATDGFWQSSVGGEATCAMSRGRPSVAEALQAHASLIYLQCPSLPTARLNKWALKKKKKGVHHRPLCMRVEIRYWRDQQTEDTITEGTSLEATGNRLKPHG